MNNSSIQDKIGQIKNIALGSDHAGFEIKKEIIVFLKDQGYNIREVGTYSTQSVDYPDYAHPVANLVQKGECDIGIVICGSGNGVNMVVNKYMSIRGALCWNEESAYLARAHNNANVCALPARFISSDEALNIVKVFTETTFEYGRHSCRIKKIPFK